MKKEFAKTVLGAVLLSSLLFSAGAFAAEPKIVDVLPNIFTFVHGTGIDSNTTVIITQEGVVVVDTRVTPAEGRKILEEIKKRTDKPIRFTINTHYHGDHTFGNQVFRDSKTIIAHKNVRRDLAGIIGRKHLDLFKTFDIPGMEEVEITPPNLIYEKQMELYLGEYRFQLIHLGPGHTDGDTFIYLDELKTIIAGDLVFNKKIPFMNDAYIDDWIESLDYLQNLKNEVVIPGHGDVGGKPLIFAMKHYLIELKTNVVKQIRDGKSLKETQDAVRPVLEKKYSDWRNLHWLDDNIKRAYNEFSLKESARGGGKL